MEQRSVRIASVALNVGLAVAGCALVLLAPRKKEAPRALLEPSPPERAERLEAREEAVRPPRERFAEAVHQLRSALWSGEKFGAIVGTVRTPDGTPVPGVSIAARTEAEGPEFRPWEEDRTPEEHLVDLVRSAPRNAWTESDANGSFRLEALRRAWSYKIEARHDRYRIAAAEGIDLNRVRVGQRVALVAEALELFPVRVACILADGSAPPSAEILVQGSGECQKYFRWKPEEPVIWSPCAEFRISATYSEGILQYRSSPLEVSAGRGGEVPEVAIRLRSVPGIRGKIVLPQGQNPVRWGLGTRSGSDCSDIRVRAIAVDAPRPLPYEVWSSGLGKEARGTSGDSPFCEYRFDDLVPGLYWVFAILPGAWKSIAAQAFVEVRGEMVAADLEAPPISADRAVRLWAYGPDGRGLRELSISFVRSDGAWWTTPAFQEDAHRWIAALPDSVLDEPQGSWVLRAESPGLGAEEIPFEPEWDREVRVEFTEPAYLVAEVEGYARSQYREGTVVLRLLREAAAPAESVEKRTVADVSLSRHGLVAFPAVRPGAYGLSIGFTPTSYGPHGLEVLRVPLRLGPGVNRISVALPPLYEAAVRIPRERARTRLWLKPKGREFGWWHGAGEAGERLALPALPAGTYVLSADSGGEMEFSLPGPLEFDFRPDERWALEVRIADPAGYLAQLGLAPGDLIAGLEGAPFGSREEIEFALGRALEKEAVRLDVARGAERLSVSADPKKLVRPELLGGALVPRRDGSGR